MRKVIIVHDQHDNSKNEAYDVEELSPFIVEYFKDKRPENLRFYHNEVSEKTDITPKTKIDVDRLESLTGTIYVVIHPAYGWLIYVYYAVVAIMAAYSVYAILTMPKPPAQSAGSSNNELAQRSNRARINSRIPDIYGEVRSFPDLIAQTYTVYQDGIEIEECLMAIGRGYFKINDMRDGDTDVANIPGTSVSVYDPFTRIDGEPIYQVGDRFNYLPKYVKKSDIINGQTIEQPNTSVIETSDVWFESPNLIKSNTVNFSKYFGSDDRIALSGAVFGIGDVVLTGQIMATQDLTIIIESTKDISEPNFYRGLLLTGALVETEEAIEREVTYGDGTKGLEIEIVKTMRDLSGQYVVNGIQKSTLNNGFHYVISLVNPKAINPNWIYIDKSYSFIAGAKLNDNDNGIVLDATYTVSSVGEYALALVNPVAINDDWEKLWTLQNSSTQGQAATVRFDTVSSKYVGWFNFEMPEAEQVILNVFFPNGLFYQDSKGGVWNEQMTVVVEVQSIDKHGNPFGDIQRHERWISRNNKSQFGETLYLNLQKTGSFRYRLSRTTATQSGKSQDTCKIKAVYSAATLDVPEYGNITIVRSKTVATDGALSVKDRKLNCLVIKKLEVDTVGPLVATRDAGQAIMDMALDPYAGRRSVSEIDIDQIKAEIQKVKDYFGSDRAVEFCYTFDDDKLSFEEMVGMVASACFCEAYRYGNKIRFKFEQPQENSVLLFNHRNKVPGSEKRTWSIGIQKDYDGVELEWTDPSDDTRTTYSIPEDGSAKNPLKITTSGIRNEAQAKTRAWREWNKLLYQTESVEFDALDESNLLQRNDRILVADGTSLETQDGEIESVDVLTLSLSQDVNLEDGQIYYINLQMPDASIDIIQCLKTDQSDQIVLSRAPRMPLVVDEDRYIKTTYSIIKATDTEKQAFLLTEMSPNDAMTNKLTAVNYDDRYYDKDHSFF